METTGTLNSTKAKGHPSSVNFKGVFYNFYQDINDQISVIYKVGTVWKYGILNNMITSTVTPSKISGIPTAFVYNNILYVLYRDENNNISNIYYDGTNWKYQNMNKDLSSIGSISLISGRPFFTIYQTKLHIIYWDKNDNISDISFDGTVWKYQNLNSLCTNASEVTGNVNVAQYSHQLHILYTGRDESISDIWFDGANWNYQNINTLKPLSPKSKSRGHCVVYMSQFHVLYRDSNNDISDIHYDSSKWHYQNLNTLKTTAPQTVAIPSGITYAGGHQLHIIYLDINNNISDVFYDGNWHYQNLSSLVSNPNPPVGKQLIYSFVEGNTLHNMYLDKSDKISDIYYDGANWHYQNLNDI